MVVSNAEKASGAGLLARSSFALVALGFLISLVVLPFLLAADMQASTKTMLLVPYAIYLVLLMLLLWFLLRTDPIRLEPVMTRFSRVRPWLILLLGIALIEINILANLVINDVASDARPLLVLLAAWTFIIFIALILAAGPQLRRWVIRTLPIWVSAGITVSLLVLVAGLYFVTQRVFNASGLLNGEADFREILFFGNQTDPAMSQDYWEELDGMQAVWSPYTYTRMESHQGKYITVDDNGLRKTTSFVAPDEEAQTVYFFGGSTVWANGARDDYTIPSLVARVLDAQDIPARVTNFGQIGYVSMQDLILFELQLAQGNIPDVAVFYQGFNDIASTNIHDAAGLPQNELNRAEEFKAGRMLDDGDFVLRRPEFSMSDVNFSLAASGGDLVAATMDRYLANVRIIRAVAQEYGVKTVFVWQPSIIFKESLTAEEKRALKENARIWSDYEDDYRAMDAHLRQRVAEEGIDHIVLMSDLFQDSQDYVFIDRVHLTEDANYVVAQALVPHIMEKQ